jgi:hypothetical protein
LKYSKNRAQRRIFGPMRDEVRGWEHSHNEERKLDAVKFGSSTEGKCWHRHNNRANTVAVTPTQRLVGCLGGAALRRRLVGCLGGAALRRRLVGCLGGAALRRRLVGYLGGAALRRRSCDMTAESQNDGGREDIHC